MSFAGTVQRKPTLRCKDLNCADFFTNAKKQKQERHDCWTRLSVLPALIADSNTEWLCHSVFMLLDHSYRCLNLGGLGLNIKALASALASNFWPRPGLGLQQKNQHPIRDGPVCLPTTGHHTMIHVEASYSARENEKLNCVILIIMI